MTARRQFLATAAAATAAAFAAPDALAFFSLGRTPTAAPEFAYEKSTKNVKAAMERLGIQHAVAQDNSYATWRAFSNHYWPAIYLVDKKGMVVYSHFGEGRYAETEKTIQALLAQ